MMYTVEKLRKMRAAARDKILAENPELKAEYEKYAAQPRAQISLEAIRRQDRAYLREGNE